MKNCQTVVRVGSPAQLVPSCVCAMLTDDPGFCTVPEMRGWLGGCCPELCPWKTDIPINSLAPAKPVVNQYKLTCGYLPHEEQCDRRGNCEGCPYAEQIVLCRYGLENCFCAEGQCPHYDKDLFCQKPQSACDTCGNDCKSKQLPEDPGCWVRACNCGSGEPAMMCTAGSKYCG